MEMMAEALRLRHECGISYGEIARAPINGDAARVLIREPPVVSRLRRTDSTGAGPGNRRRVRDLGFRGVAGGEFVSIHGSELGAGEPGQGARTGTGGVQGHPAGSATHRISPRGEARDLAENRRERSNCRPRRLRPPLGRPDPQSMDSPRRGARSAARSGRFRSGLRWPTRALLAHPRVKGK